MKKKTIPKLLIMYRAPYKYKQDDSKENRQASRRKPSKEKQHQMSQTELPTKQSCACLN